MEKALLILAPIIFAVGVGVIFGFLRKEKARKKEGLNRRDFVVHSSYVWAILMITLAVILLAIIIVTCVTDPLSVGVIIVFSFLALVFAIGGVQMLREKVQVKGDEIIYTPLIGKKKTYTFRDIERVDYKRTGYYVYVDGKKAFSLEISSTGADLFYEIARERELNKSQE